MPGLCSSADSRSCFVSFRCWITRIPDGDTPRMRKRRSCHPFGIPVVIRLATLLVFAGRSAQITHGIRAVLNGIYSHLNFILTIEVHGCLLQIETRDTNLCRGEPGAGTWDSRACSIARRLCLAKVGANSHRDVAATRCRDPFSRHRVSHSYGVLSKTAGCSGYCERS